MPKNGRLSAKEFDNIHFLHDRGLEISEIMRITGRSEDTIRLSLKVETFDGYLEQNKKTREARIQRESKNDLDDRKKIIEENDMNDLVEYLQAALNIAIRLKVRRSPEKDDEEYLKSIQGHLDLLTNQWQELWDNALSSDVINFFIDMGTAILKAVDDFGLFKTAAIAAVGALTFKAKGGGRAKKLSK